MSADKTFEDAYVLLVLGSEMLVTRLCLSDLTLIIVQSMSKPMEWSRQLAYSAYLPPKYPIQSFSPTELSEKLLKSNFLSACWQH